MGKLFMALTITCFVLFLSRCAVEKDNVSNDINRLMLPVPPSFSSADSARLIANWTTGIKFYKANCARCHGIFGKGKDSIPNFSKEQMDDYKTNFLAGDKQNHAVMGKMTEEELNMVFLFITNVRRDLNGRISEQRANPAR